MEIWIAIITIKCDDEFKNNGMPELQRNWVRLVLDGAICLTNSFEFTVYHCMKLKAFTQECASLNRITADKLHSVIIS